METQSYSASRIMRRCAQLGISYDEVINSAYAKQLQWQAGQFKIQYKDGVHGTTGWGNEKKEIQPNKTTPHSLEEMRRFLDCLEQ
jgi:hypothetical protein